MISNTDTNHGYRFPHWGCRLRARLLLQCSHNVFVELWMDADAKLLPQVEDVRERIARLTGEPRSTIQSLPCTLPVRNGCSR